MHEVQVAPHHATRYERPRTLEAALELLAAGDSRIIAGGSDLLLEMHRRVRTDFKTLVDLTGIAGLNTIDESTEALTLGPLVTHSQAVASRLVTQHALPLAQACWEVGSPQLRNRSTIAGNLVTASPANDTISALWALDASVTLRSQSGKRQVRLRDFYLGVRRTVMAPDEILTAIEIPKLGPDTAGVFVKLGLRRAQAISVVHAAMTVTRDGAKVTAAEVSLGSVAPTIVSAPEAAAALIGSHLDEAAIKEAARLAAAAVTPIDDMRATADYRSATVAVTVERGLRAIAAGATATRWPATPVLLGRGSGITGSEADAISIAPGEAISATVNGEPTSGSTRPNETLLDWLRERGLTGTKEGCAEGECGACTVWLDGDAVMSCLVAAPAAAGAQVLTIEGLADADDLHPVQEQFIEHGAVQCGFCIPGILMAAARLIEDTPRPSRDDVARALSGNLCRCTGYYKIIDAVVDAAAQAEAAS